MATSCVHASSGPFLLPPHPTPSTHKSRAGTHTQHVHAHAARTRARARCTLQPTHQPEARVHGLPHRLLLHLHLGDKVRLIPAELGPVLAEVPPGGAGVSLGHELLLCPTRMHPGFAACLRDRCMCAGPIGVPRSWMHVRLVAWSMCCPIREPGCPYLRRGDASRRTTE